MLIKLDNMENDKKKFVNWLKQFIKIDGIMSGKELANKIEVDPSTVSGWLTGRTKGPDFSTRLKICENVGVTYEEVIHRQPINGEGTPETQGIDTEQETDSEMKSHLKTALKHIDSLQFIIDTKDKEIAKLKAEVARKSVLGEAGPFQNYGKT